MVFLLNEPETHTTSLGLLDKVAGGPLPQEIQGQTLFISLGFSSVRRGAREGRRDVTRQARRRH